MKFIQRFGRLLGSTFLFLAIVLKIMCLIAGHTPLRIVDCQIMFMTISIIATGASITARKIMREEREAFKEIMDKAFKVSEVKKDANVKDTD